MTSNEILDEITVIVRNILSDNSIVLSNSTIPKDIAGWDSLMHLEIIASIEEHYKIKFKYKEVMSFKNVGDIVEEVMKRKNNLEFKI